MHRLLPRPRPLASSRAGPRRTHRGRAPSLGGRPPDIVKCSRTEAAVPAVLAFWRVTESWTAVLVSAPEGGRRSCGFRGPCARINGPVGRRQCPRLARVQAEPVAPTATQCRSVATGRSAASHSFVRRSLGTGTSRSPTSPTASGPPGPGQGPRQAPALAVPEGDPLAGLSNRYVTTSVVTIGLCHKASSSACVRHATTPSSPWR